MGTRTAASSFLYVPNVRGPSKHPRFRHWIPLWSATLGRCRGHTAMLLNKAFDRSSPRLTELWMTGRSTEVMKLVTLGPGAIRVERTLTNCTIVHQTRVRDRPGDWYEHVAIGFERMKLMYSRSSFQDR